MGLLVNVVGPALLGVSAAVFSSVELYQRVCWVGGTHCLIVSPHRR
jgi:hypothetical protein